MPHFTGQPRLTPNIGIFEWWVVVKKTINKWDCCELFTKELILRCAGRAFFPNQILPAPNPIKFLKPVKIHSNLYIQCKSPTYPKFQMLKINRNFLQDLTETIVRIAYGALYDNFRKEKRILERININFAFKNKNYKLSVCLDLKSILLNTNQFIL